jgi:5-keto-L-gluconate epimerase
MLLPDVFHMNIEESLIQYKSHIGFIHFADSNRQAPGLGHVDFKKILSALAEIGYDSAIDMEIIPKPDDLSAARQAITYLKSIKEEIA